MVSKLKLLLMFAAVVGISCMVSDITGIGSKVYAQDAKSAKSKECPSSKSKNENCTSKSNCSKKAKCDKGGDCKIDKMMGLARCAKKELLKEKMKANLEKKIGANLDKIADLLVDAMLEECKSSMENKALRAELEKKINEVFSGADKQ